MAKLFLIIGFWFSFSQLTSAQNLVPNPSFEDTVYCSGIGLCPTDIGQSCVLKFWNYTSFSPDYFKSCDSISPVSIPHNQFGFQYDALFNNGYIGLYTREGSASSDGREYIGAKLIDSIMIGQRYFVSFKASLANCANCATNNLGVLFSTQPLIFNFPISFPNFSQIYSTNIIVDTLNWVSISKSFIADSAFKYVFIGNFFDDIHTDSLILHSNTCSISSDTTTCFAYYYIDDFCISSDSLTCNLNVSVKEFEKKSDFELFPNPADQYLVISLPEQNCLIRVFDVLGELRLIDQIENKKATLDLTNFKPGIYFLQVQANSKIINQMFIVSK